MISSSIHNTEKVEERNRQVTLYARARATKGIPCAKSAAACVVVLADAMRARAHLSMRRRMLERRWLVMMDWIGLVPIETQPR